MERTFDPYNAFKKFSEQWEKQANEFIHTSTNNEGFVKFTKVGIDAQVRFMKIFNKNQELMANQFNLPTKTDVASVAKLSVQTEEKLDLLEEQIWRLQDSVDTSNKEIAGVVDLTKEIIKLSKQLKTDLSETHKELTAVKELRSNLGEFKGELGEIHSLKEELIGLKELLKQDKTQKTQQMNNVMK